MKIQTNHNNHLANFGLTVLTISSRLTTDDNAGVAAKEDHAVKCCISNGKDVGRSFKEVPASVLRDVVVAVDIECSVRVH